LSTSELREVRQLREENTRLKRLVADLTLDKVMLQDILGKKADGHGKARVGPPPGEPVPAGAEASIPVARLMPIDRPLRVSISR
jgi:putative transposase